jgi:alkylation response protein AidB-like acyl-CoA dehydrogenase
MPVERPGWRRSGNPEVGNPGEQAEDEMDFTLTDDQRRLQKQTLGFSTAKYFANEMTREVCGAALRLAGGCGYDEEYPIEQCFCDARGSGIAGGAIDFEKINIAAALVGRRFNQPR